MGFRFQQQASLKGFFGYYYQGYNAFGVGLTYSTPPYVTFKPPTSGGMSIWDSTGAVATELNQDGTNLDISTGIDVAGGVTVDGDLSVAAARLGFTFSGAEGIMEASLERMSFYTPDSLSAQTRRLLISGGTDVTDVVVYASNLKVGGGDFVMYSNKFLSTETARLTALGAFTTTGDVSADGMILRADIPTATPPTTEGIFAEYQIMDADSTDVLLRFGFAGSNRFELINRMHGGAIYLTGEDNSGNEKQVFIGDPDGSANVMYAGDYRLLTVTTGVDIRGNADNDPTTGGTFNSNIYLENTSSQRGGQLGHANTVDLQLINNVHGGNLSFKGEVVAGTQVTMLTLDPDALTADFGTLDVTGANLNVSMWDQIDATGITDGYVLTADGAGNAAWEAAAAGGGNTLTLESSTGDATIYLKADTSNTVETSNPFIRFEQDGNGVATVVGSSGASGVDAEGNVMLNAASNGFNIHMLYASGTIGLGVGGDTAMRIGSANSTTFYKDINVEGNIEATGSVSGLSNPINITGTTPGMMIYESDGILDEKAWKMYSSGSIFYIRAATDAGSSDANILRGYRSGATQITRVVLGEGTSAVEIPGELLLTSSTNNDVKIHAPSIGNMRIETEHGSGDFGALNSSYFHMATERGKFYFYDDVVMNATEDIRKAGEGNYLYNKSSSYSSDQSCGVTFSTSAASGGVTGDIWFQYT
jgi:hypothetical protein